MHRRIQCALIHVRIQRARKREREKRERVGKAIEKRGSSSDITIFRTRYLELCFENHVIYCKCSVIFPVAYFITAVDNYLLRLNDNVIINTKLSLP